MPATTTDEAARLRHGVFYPALGFLAVVVALSIAFPSATETVLTTLQNTVVRGLGWYYVLIVSGFVIFAIWMGVGRFGDITLGKDDDEPEFGIATWFSMLFAAGMGIGLVFWGAAEPLTFFVDPKPGVTGSEGQLINAAMSQVFLHWGFHAWAIYVVVGLAMAYAIHRKGRPVSLRWALEPVLGDRVKGWAGDVIDIAAIVGTVAGVATSLGLGVQQISAGLVSLGVIDEALDWHLVALIVGVTAIATFSVVSGVARGIKWLSNVNLGLAGVFLVAILALGPTLFLLRDFVQNIGNYLFNLVPLSFNTSALTGEAGIEWQAAWTTFYWGWWISWSPFVGLFIARISRGRTVREFIAGVMLVPVLVTMAWFTVMGGTAIYQQMNGQNLTNPDGSVTSENALFQMLENLPASGLLSGVAILMIVIFFVTSSDSGSLVVDMLSHGGHPEPPTWSRVLWSSIEGLVAIGLLLAGGLVALQTGAILTALPFSVIMIAMCFATYKALKAEYREIRRLGRRARERELQLELTERVTPAVTSQVVDTISENFDDHFGEHVDERISNAIDEYDAEHTDGSRPDTSGPARS
ncbi:BCCT family transporter [uncultured Aeromicrobium sp.]|uniref:BCCT family transporter n=1 Tax=uncultured Aeromicrobium sp. TaxID=337820 RepID=UPI0025DA9809|nr:BCCT family transporter [uncultured Aeromicrobium sp.]